MIRILHVEDEIDFHTLLKIRLHKLEKNLEFTLVESGKKAIELIEKVPFDCILCDFQMPEIDGLELLKIVRNKEKKTPFILLTSQGNEEIAAEAFRSGVTDYFTKQEEFSHYERILNSIKKHVLAYDQTIKHSKSKSRLETKLTETEKLYRTLFEQSPGAVVVIDPETTLPIEFSDTVLSMLGYSREEFTKLRISDYEAVENPEETNKHIEKILQKGKDEFETKFRTKEGEVKNILVIIRVIEISGKTVFHNIFLDITERKKAENLIREKNNKIQDHFVELTHVYNNTPIGLSYMDTDLRCKRINQILADIDGVSIEDHIGKTLEEVLPELAHTLKPKIQQVLKSGENLTFEARGKSPIKPEEERYWMVSYYPVKSSDGTVMGVGSVCQDITDSNQAEEKLKLQGAILENMEEGVYLVGLEDVIIKYTNPKFEKTFGYGPGEMLGKHASIVNAPTNVSPEQRADEIMKVIYQTGAWHGEINNIKKNGTPFWCYANVSIFDHEKFGKVIVAVHTDITERKQAEEELKKYRLNLEDIIKERTLQLEEAQNKLVQKERLAVLGQLAAMVAHELRNPLGTIRFSIAVLKNKLKNIVGVKNALNRVDRSISRCDTIISELLDYARSSHPHTRKTAIDIWLKEVLKEQNIPDEIILKMDLKSGAQIQIDQDLFRRAIINVFDNACQAMLKNKREEQRELTLTTQTQKVGDFLEISIIDTGQGISPDDIQHIFQPLYSTKTFGVGLGLPIVKKIVEQHGGVVEIASEEEKGTKVTLRMPTTCP